MDLKIGDTVRLKSGGPIMTIEDIGNYGINHDELSVKCVWFDKLKKCESVFKKEMVEIVT